MAEAVKKPAPAQQPVKQQPQVQSKPQPQAQPKSDEPKTVWGTFNYEDWN